MRTILAALLVLLLGIAHPTAYGGQTLSIAIVPQFPPDQVYKAWVPVLERLTAMTGLNFDLKVFATIPAFEKAFLKGEPDVAYMNPYHAVMANRAAGYEPIIRDRQDLTGILVVRKDAAIGSVKELDGKVVAFPAPNAFGASLYMRALLTEQEHVRITPAYVKTHSNVYRHVIAGRAAAGGAVQRTLDKESEGVRSQLRVLYRTPPAPSHPVAVHPRVSAQVRQALQEAFLEMGKHGDPKDNELLKAVQMPQPVAASYRDYTPLEKLGLEKYVVLGNE